MTLDDAQRQEIVRIAARHGARGVRLFGSHARGTPSPTSDVDFIVEVGPEPDPLFPGGPQAELEEFLGRPVDVLTEDALHWYVRERILREAVPL